MASSTTAMRETGFCNNEVAIAAQLHLPPDFDQSRTWPAIVLSTPGSSGNAEIGAIYARKFAGRGFVAITFDASYGDGSCGAARHLDDPATRVADLRCAVDHLMTLAFVDDDRIAVLGVCAGSADAVNAALSEHRFKAVATVAGTDTSRAAARGAAQRRERHAPAVTPSLVQPLMVIVGGGDGTTGQYETGRALYALARGPDKALVVIPDAGRGGLHHRDEYIDPAIGRLAPFLHFHLDP